MIDKLKSRIEESGKVEDEIWVEVAKFVKPKEVKKNEILVRYSTTSQEAYFILSGSFVCSQISESGVQKAIWFFFDEVFNFMTCPDSFFLQEPTKYELKAMEDSTILSINKKRIDHWITNYPGFNRFFIDDFTKEFVKIYEARSNLLTFSSLEYLQYVHDKFPFLLSKLPAYYIAEFMGISAEWYSKLQKKLRT